MSLATNASQDDLAASLAKVSLRSSASQGKDDEAEDARQQRMNVQAGQSSLTPPPQLSLLAVSLQLTHALASLIEATTAAVSRCYNTCCSPYVAHLVCIACLLLVCMLVCLLVWLACLLALTTSRH